MSKQKINDKVTVETFEPGTPDHAALQAAREEKALAAIAAERRAAHVQALETERAFLERQPKPNQDRLAQVAEQLDAYAEKPARRVRETAGGGAPSPAPQTAARKRAARAPKKKSPPRTRAAAAPETVEGA